MKPYYSDSHAEIWHGDCREVLPHIGPVDAVVTDPPYGLEFMGKDWDHGVPGVEFWRLILDAMKPGAHLVAFGGTRTHHRLMCGIEDAGFQIRDCLMFLFGSGFPKSLDVSKAIDKAAGAEREVVGSRLGRPGVSASGANLGRGFSRSKEGRDDFPEPALDLTAPATDAARQWDGWGTALKPAWEPIILARKPLIGTVAANVLEHGTGALNIDGCRVEGPQGPGGWGGSNQGVNPDRSFVHSPKAAKYRTEQHPSGRWPANLILDEASAVLLDEQSGERYGGNHVSPREIGRAIEPGGSGKRSTEGPGERSGYADCGGASRFFYTSKASRADRGEGNDHPTVKPSDLMSWLTRLVTPPGGTVLDPFMGSGTTLYAAKELGFRAIGIELEESHCVTAVRRLGQGVLDFGDVS